MVDKKLGSILEGLPFTLNEQQLSFITKFIESGGNWCLSGLAGSGKSTIMLVLKKYYGDEIVFFASSGVASLNMPENIGNGTGHSGLSLPLTLSTELNHKKVSFGTSALFASSDLIKIIVIDECYGYNSDNLDMISRRIERFNKRTNKRQKRNIRLLLVGDPAQQITITDKQLKSDLKDRWGHHLMFRSQVWARFNFKYAVLNKVERQKDKVFKACLDVIRYYEEDRFLKCLRWLNKNYSSMPPKDKLVLAATNKTVDRINEGFLQQNPNRKTNFYGMKNGKFNMKDLLVKDHFVACVGRKVMTVNNDKEGRWVNGSVGIITDVVVGAGVTVEFSDGNVEFVEPHTWENKEAYVEAAVLQSDGEYRDELRERLVGSFTGLPLIPANAISISKSQGVTLTEPFVIDLEGTFLYSSPNMEDFGTNFAYVALSRAVSSDLITLAKRVEKDHIKPCIDSLNFWFECCEKSEI